MRWLLVAVLMVPAAAQMTAPQTVKGLKTAEGLEATLWAAEPMVVNPTNMDVDERGRVWYLEAVNYRRKLKNLPDLRKTGDRIVILEDTNGDGKADKKKIFFESPDLRAPIGISVLGNKVVVSQSPDILVFTRDEQDRVVKKEVLLTGWGGVDHDHGLHAVTFGHDGRYYFNSGDQGFDVTDKSGKRFVSSKQGPYYAGTALRVNPDGTNFTVLGHNFRNPYELALDSFGNIWQSDNDDDGNAWTRFNYVLLGGNFGYWGPGGRSWREDRGTHFHQENPGVVPNIARLGAGSPCGLVIYEGNLLPAKYRGAPLHAEAGKRVINTYFIEGEGAGYRLTAEPTVAGADTWFRPADVAVGPDGAVFIADWYDPGVGGHNMGDSARGRIYRLAPPKYKPQNVALDLESPAGLQAALRSPAQAMRFLAWTKLHEQGEKALPVLTAAWKSNDDILRARALWLLGPLGEQGRAALKEAAASSDARFRVLAMRVAAANGLPLPALAEDPSPVVRRELAVLTKSNDTVLALTKQYNGSDRWYLEALGIAMQGREAALLPEVKKLFSNPADPRLLRLAWRMRVPESLPWLASVAGDGGQPMESRQIALEAMAMLPGADAASAVAKVGGDEQTPAALRAAGLTLFGRRLFSEWSGYRSSPEITGAIQKSLATAALAKPAVELTEELGDAVYADALLKIAKTESFDEETRTRAISALGRAKQAKYTADLDALSAKGTLPIRMAALRAMGTAQETGLEPKLQKLILAKEPNELRTEAVRILARSPKGANLILDLEQKQDLPAELRNAAANAINQNRDPQIKARAAKVLPPPATRNKAQINTRSVVARQGDVATGRKVFFNKEGANCGLCHAVEGTETKVGPNLATIGDKLGKDALLDSIMNPSAGIAHEYVAWVFDTKSQGQVIGIIAEDTPARVVIKNEQGEKVWLKPADIKGRRQSKLSMMPEDLVTRMTEQDLVDLLEFLSTLKDQRRASR